MLAEFAEGGPLAWYAGTKMSNAQVEILTFSHVADPPCRRLVRPSDSWLLLGGCWLLVAGFSNPVACNRRQFLRATKSPPPWNLGRTAFLRIRKATTDLIISPPGFILALCLSSMPRS